MTRFPVLFSGCMRLEGQLYVHKYHQKEFNKVDDTSE